MSATPVAHQAYRVDAVTAKDSEPVRAFKGEHLAWGMGSLGTITMISAVSSLYLYFLVAVVKLSPALAGTLIFASKIIDMISDNAWPHAMHLHGHHFRVVRRAGKPVAGAPWRDTELVMPGERVAIAFVAGDPGKWLFHCHMLEHQAAGMITWIEVV